jgi:hypothetical protein
MGKATSETQWLRMQMTWARSSLAERVLRLAIRLRAAYSFS